MEIDATAPPVGLVVRPQLGLLTSTHVDGQLVHEAATNLYETRATITPSGDYLLMFPEGKHYGGNNGKVNDMIAYRSSNKGKTWTGPRVAFNIDYSQHGFIPLVPRGTERIYAFGTQPIEGQREGSENCPIGFRYSDDDGRTWSDATLIRPQNDPDFKGMSVMRMCETDSGAWLVGSHAADWSTRPIKTRQYVLRSDDRGKTWTSAPRPRHDGWFVEGFNRMDEGRPINLGDGRVMLMARTPQGRLWAAWSEDDGRSWSDPQPTPLVHPDAPPMLFHHHDGKTLVAFHHNRHSGGHFHHADRSEIWVSLSADEGRTWTQPRFVLANALAANTGSSFRDHQCSYLDAFVDGGVFHLFVPHRWKRALHLTLAADDIERLPTKKDLEQALSQAAPERFTVDDRPAFVIAPTKRLAQPTPWVLYAPTLGRGLPGEAEDWMFKQFLDAGIAIAGVDVGESYGSPRGRATYNALHERLTQQRGFAQRACLLARSRGGLMLYCWAVENPEKVKCVAGIYPVCSIASYPGLERACGAYNLTAEQLNAELSKHNPPDRIASLARANVPIFHIHGDVDRVVPLADNSGLLAERYRAAGGRMTLQIAKGQGHNMWRGFFECQELVDFVVEHAVSLESEADEQSRELETP